MILDGYACATMRCVVVVRKSGLHYRVYKEFW